MLKKIRENAFAYLHGHSVGGTNPSLLEALASTKINLLFDVGFNYECAKQYALYFNEREDNLSQLLDKVEKFDEDEIHKYDNGSTQIVENNYNWNKIISTYESLFLED